MEPIEGRKEPIEGRNALEQGLHVLERYNDPELVEAYRAYMQRLEELVGQENMDTFAYVYQRDRRQLYQQSTGTGLSPQEQAVRETVATDSQVHALYDQYIALAKAHGLADPEFEQIQ
jgi:hypothetical protein